MALADHVGTTARFLGYVQNSYSVTIDSGENRAFILAIGSDMSDLLTSATLDNVEPTGVVYNGVNTSTNCYSFLYWLDEDMPAAGTATLRPVGYNAFTIVAYANLSDVNQAEKATAGGVPRSDTEFDLTVSPHATGDLVFSFLRTEVFVAVNSASGTLVVGTDADGRGRIYGSDTLAQMTVTMASSVLAGYNLISFAPAGSASTAPTISSGTVTAQTTTGLTIGFTTDTANGTAYYALYAVIGDVPTGTDAVIGAAIAAGTGAVAYGSKAVSAAVAQTFPATTGLDPNTTYLVRVAHFGTPA